MAGIFLAFSFAMGYSGLYIRYASIEWVEGLLKLTLLVEVLTFRSLKFSTFANVILIHPMGCSLLTDSNSLPFFSGLNSAILNYKIRVLLIDDPVLV